MLNGKQRTLQRTAEELRGVEFLFTGLGRLGIPTNTAVFTTLTSSWRVVG
jgi:hypothetical protein